MVFIDLEKIKLMIRYPEIYWYFLEKKHDQKRYIDAIKGMYYEIITSVGIVREIDTFQL